MLHDKKDMPKNSKLLQTKKALKNMVEVKCILTPPIDYDKVMKKNSLW